MRGAIKLKQHLKLEEISSSLNQDITVSDLSTGRKMIQNFKEIKLPEHTKVEVTVIGLGSKKYNNDGTLTFG